MKGRFFLGGNFPGVTFLGGNFPGWECFSWKFTGWELSYAGAARAGFFQVGVFWVRTVRVGIFRVGVFRVRILFIFTWFQHVASLNYFRIFLLKADSDTIFQHLKTF